MKIRMIFICAVALALCLPLSVNAADEANKADMWIVTVKQGHTQAFETALKAHLDHRAELGDTRYWQVYTPVTGSNLNDYYLRACCYTWADSDSYREWSVENNTLEHWMGNVDQHVESYTHSMSTMDFANSHWPEGMGANYVGVTDFHVKPGHGAAFDASKAKISQALIAGEWPRRWSWGEAISGPSISYVAAGYDNYAAMAPPETGFMEVLAEQMESEEKAGEAMAEFMSHVAGTEYQIYAWRPDLSMAIPEQVAQN